MLGSKKVERANIAHTLLFSEPKSAIFMCMELLITVVNSCYQSKKAFCQWLEKFSRTRELNKKNPPFSQFFDERFEELPHRQIRNAGITTSTSYEFIPNVSLYANVFYLWYKVFLDGGNTEISIEDKELKHSFSKDISDLKRFNETIKFIK